MDHRGVEWALTATPEPDGTGITGVRRHALPQGARQQQQIAVEPSNACLCLGRCESVKNESVGGQIELPKHHRVAAAA